MVEAAARVRSGLEAALFDMSSGRPLPAYLTAAAVRYAEATAERTSKEHLIAKLVQRYADKGYPKSNSSRGPSAFEMVADDLGISAKTVQRAYESNPCDSDPADENGHLNQQD